MEKHPDAMTATELWRELGATVVWSDDTRAYEIKCDCGWSARAATIIEVTEKIEAHLRSRGKISCRAGKAREAEMFVVLDDGDTWAVLSEECSLVVPMGPDATQVLKGDMTLKHAIEEDDRNGHQH